MKKTTSVYMAAVMAALVLTGCGKHEFGLSMTDGKHGEITALNATEGDTVSAGSLEVGENDFITVEAEFTDGKVKLALTPEGSENAEPIVETEISGTQNVTLNADTGNYTVTVTAVGNLSGKAEITVEESEAEASWASAASAEEAGKGAGLNWFTVMDEYILEIGDAKDPVFSYYPGIAQAYFKMENGDLYIWKGIGTSGDVLYDANEYAHTWQQNIKGLVVNCYGAEEGKATKVTWVVDDTSYELLAGTGSPDFALSPDDINSLVNGIQ
jgi:hypothetical protein